MFILISHFLIFLGTANGICMFYKQPGGLPPICVEGRKIELTNGSKEHILSVINGFRTKVAKGEETGKDGELLPKAYGMRQMHWDDQLTSLAEVSVKDCRSRPDLCRAADVFPNPDQYSVTVQLTQSVNNLTEEKVTGAIDSALNQMYQNKDWTTRSKIDKHNGSNPYLTMVYGWSTHVGCGINVFYNIDQGQEMNDLLLVCNFSHQPIEGQKVYETDPPHKERVKLGWSDKCGCEPGLVESEGCLCIGSVLNCLLDWKCNTDPHNMTAISNANSSTNIISITSKMQAVDAENSRTTGAFANIFNATSLSELDVDKPAKLIMNTITSANNTNKAFNISNAEQTSNTRSETSSESIFNTDNNVLRSKTNSTTPIQPKSYIFTDSNNTTESIIDITINNTASAPNATAKLFPQINFQRPEEVTTGSIINNMTTLTFNNVARLSNLTIIQSTSNNTIDLITKNRTAPTTFTSRNVVSSNDTTSTTKISILNDVNQIIIKNKFRRVSNTTNTLTKLTTNLITVPTTNTSAELTTDSTIKSNTNISKDPIFDTTDFSTFYNSIELFTNTTTVETTTKKIFETLTSVDVSFAKEQPADIMTKLPTHITTSFIEKIPKLISNDTVASITNDKANTNTNITPIINTALKTVFSKKTNMKYDLTFNTTKVINNINTTTAQPTNTSDKFDGNITAEFSTEAITHIENASDVKAFLNINLTDKITTHFIEAHAINLTTVKFIGTPTANPNDTKIITNDIKQITHLRSYSADNSVNTYTDPLTRNTSNVTMLNAHTLLTTSTVKPFHDIPIKEITALPLSMPNKFSNTIIPTLRQLPLKTKSILSRQEPTLSQMPTSQPSDGVIKTPKQRLIPPLKPLVSLSGELPYHLRREPYMPSTSNKIMTKHKKISVQYPTSFFNPCSYESTCTCSPLWLALKNLTTPIVETNSRYGGKIKSKQNSIAKRNQLLKTILSPWNIIENKFKNNIELHRILGSSTYQPNFTLNHEPTAKINARQHWKKSLKHNGGSNKNPSYNIKTRRQHNKTQSKQNTQKNIETKYKKYKVPEIINHINNTNSSRFPATNTKPSSKSSIKKILTSKNNTNMKKQQATYIKRSKKPTIYNTKQIAPKILTTPRRKLALRNNTTQIKQKPPVKKKTKTIKRQFKNYTGPISMPATNTKPSKTSRNKHYRTEVIKTKTKKLLTLKSNTKEIRALATNTKPSKKTKKYTTTPTVTKTLKKLPRTTIIKQNKKVVTHSKPSKKFVSKIKSARLLTSRLTTLKPITPSKHCGLLGGICNSTPVQEQCSPNDPTCFSLNVDIPLLSFLQEVSLKKQYELEQRILNAHTIRPRYFDYKQESSDAKTNLNQISQRELSNDVQYDINENSLNTIDSLKNKFLISNEAADDIIKANTKLTVTKNKSPEDNLRLDTRYDVLRILNDLNAEYDVNKKYKHSPTYTINGNIAVTKSPDYSLSKTEISILTDIHSQENVAPEILLARNVLPKEISHSSQEVENVSLDYDKIIENLVLGYENDYNSNLLQKSLTSHLGEDISEEHTGRTESFYDLKSDHVFTNLLDTESMESKNNLIPKKEIQVPASIKNESILQSALKYHNNDAILEVSSTITGHAHVMNIEDGVITTKTPIPTQNQRSSALYEIQRPEIKQDYNYAKNLQSYYYDGSDILDSTSDKTLTTSQDKSHSRKYKKSYDLHSLENVASEILLARTVSPKEISYLSQEEDNVSLDYHKIIENLVLEYENDHNSNLLQKSRKSNLGENMFEEHTAQTTEFYYELESDLEFMNEELLESKNSLIPEKEIQQVPASVKKESIFQGVQKRNNGDAILKVSSTITEHANAMNIENGVITTKSPRPTRSRILALYEMDRPEIKHDYHNEKNLQSYYDNDSNILDDKQTQLSDTTSDKPMTTSQDKPQLNDRNILISYHNKAPHNRKHLPANKKSFFRKVPRFTLTTPAEIDKNTTTKQIFDIIQLVHSTELESKDVMSNPLSHSDTAINNFKNTVSRYEDDKNGDEQRMNANMRSNSLSEPNAIRDRTNHHIKTLINAIEPKPKKSSFEYRTNTKKDIDSSKRKWIFFVSSSVEEDNDTKFKKLIDKIEKENIDKNLNQIEEPKEKKIYGYIFQNVD